LNHYNEILNNSSYKETTLKVTAFIVKIGAKKKKRKKKKTQDFNDKTTFGIASKTK